MSDERDPDVRPTWSETGLPLCDDACPNFDGKRCKAMGFRPDRFCEPMLLQQAEEATDVTTERDRLRAALDVAKRALEDILSFIARYDDGRLYFEDWRHSDSEHLADKSTGALEAITRTLNGEG